MKIQLSSTLPFTPVQLDSRQAGPRRVVGQLHGTEGTREFRTAVYEFRHGDNDEIHYRIDPQERVYLDPLAESDLPLASVSAKVSEESLEWLPHDDSLTYKPYAFVVMNAVSKLIGDWDGVVYQTPSGERLRDSVLNATLQVVDSCVCNKLGLWVKVNLTAEKGSAGGPGAALSHQLGWVPLHTAAH